MDTTAMLHMYPDLPTLEEELTRAGFACRAVGEGTARFADVRRYRAGMAVSEDILYVVDAGDAAAFPGGYASARPMETGGAGLVCPGADPARLLDALLELFDRFRAQERRLDELVFQNASLNELCEAGAALLENPICIHDDWFVMIARSQELSQVLPPDYIMSSSREFIPRIIIDDFKNDTEYLETYVHREAQLWEGSPNQPSCLYMNLWEGEIYRGRLLVVKYRRGFRRADYRLTEVLTQRAMELLGRKRLGVDRPHRSMDDIVYDLLEGRPTEPQEIGQLTRMLDWQRSDSVLCIRMRQQRPDDSILMAHALHSELFRAFPEGYIMFNDRQQCVVLNLRKDPTTPARLSHRLSPLCRDYCLYAGVSSPVRALRDWPVAWRQAELALERAFELRSERWIVPFSDCALDTLLDGLPAPMALNHLVAPELIRLMAHDAAHDTPYFETLRAYLLLERDIPRTSEHLIIHRTTLLYRLRKISELVELNLNDPDKRLYLLMSLKILEREGRRS